MLTQNKSRIFVLFVAIGLSGVGLYAFGIINILHMLLILIIDLVHYAMYADLLKRKNFSLKGGKQNN